MSQTAAIGVLLMVFGLFGAKADASPSAQFWDWFELNEAGLFSIKGGGDPILKELAVEMERVNADLTFEIGPVVNRRREFVISAGGLKSAFIAVETLYAGAPVLERWKWTKFRPRRTHINDLQFGGKAVKADDVHFLLARDKDKLGVVLFFDGYSEQEKNTFGQIGYLLLDEALGEYAVEMQVGFVDIQPRASKYFAQAAPIRELPKRFDEFWAKSAH